MSDQRRSFHLALPPHDPRSRRIVQWLAGQPAGSDLSALLRGVIIAGLEAQAIAACLDQQQVLLQRIAADLAALRQSGATVPPAVPLDPAPDLVAEDLAALGDLFGSFDDI